MAEPSEHNLEATLDVLLAPIAQLMIRHGMTIGGATEMLKQALVRSVGDDVSDSAVALKTGVHRKDVKRLRAPADDAPTRARLNAAAAVLMRWSEDTAFQNRAGGPRKLTRKDVRKVPGFDSLVRRAKVDTAPATVLTELIDAGVVQQDDEGGLTLLSTALVPADASSKLSALGATAGAHLAAATQNVLADGDPPFFDRALRFSNVSAETAARLDSMAREGGETLLALLSSLAYDLKQDDILSTSPRDATFVFGAFSVPDPTLKTPATKDEPNDD